MTTVTKKDVLRYMFTPQIGMRFKQLFSNGFQYIPYFIALVYQIVRLLPDNHPYLNPRNTGQYGIRHVVAAAANNLVLSRKNIDQIILFFAVIIGLIIIVIQIALLGTMVFVQPALAQMPDSIADFFITQNHHQDLAFIFLDMVFGVEDMFDSCVSVDGVDCLDVNGEAVVDSSGAWLLSNLGFPFPIHIAMHQLFRIYSIGLLNVAVIITCYFIATILLETAQTGTPFGKRFNKVWAPIRIVVAFGLLMPVQYNGLNSAQMIVLYAAKFGSGFATNGWNLFYNTLSTETAGDQTAMSNALAGGHPDSQFISRPNPPEIGAILQMVFTAKICQQLELDKFDPDTNTYSHHNIRAWLIKADRTGANGGVLDVEGTDYNTMINFINGANQATIRFGYIDDDVFSRYTGHVGPVCGEIVLPILDPRIPGSNNPPEEGVRIIQNYYWFMVNSLWFDAFSPGYFIDPNDPVDPNDPLNENFPLNFVRANTHFNADPDAPTPSPEFAGTLTQAYAGALDSILTGQGINVNGAIAAQQEEDAWEFSDDLLQKGWAGAGIWYNKIAQINGSLSAAVFNVPIITKYPAVMEQIMAKKRAQEQLLLVNERFKPEWTDDEQKELFFNSSYEGEYSKALWAGYEYWDKSDYGASSFTTLTGNTLLDMLSQFFGTDGLFSMRRNADVHPLAQLVGVGRSMIQSGIRALGFSVGGAVIGKAMQVLDKTGKNGVVAANTMVSFCMTIATIGFTTGFILFYVVPFLPFIYFFFSVGGWIKGIFEAMVGTPLWALAHIRIDGNGLPGQAAANGYYLIFEIFLRPILIIFGLIASISTFSSIVYVLNNVWDIAVGNLTGFDHSLEFATAAERAAMGGEDQSLADIMRGPIDQFFFTVIYTIVVYMMALSSFKLIDLIPNNILRWMGQSVSTFNDQNQNAAEGLVGKAAGGGQQAIKSIGGGIQGMLTIKGQGKGE